VKKMGDNHMETHRSITRTAVASFRRLMSLPGTMADDDAIIDLDRLVEEAIVSGAYTVHERDGKRQAVVRIGHGLVAMVRPNSGSTPHREAVIIVVPDRAARADTTAVL
jgi:hypothetical protein